MSSRRPDRSAMRSNRATLSESAQCRSSNTTIDGPGVVSPRMISSPARRRSTIARPASPTVSSSAGSVRPELAHPSTASSSSSNGRLSAPGSACPMRIGMLDCCAATSSCTRRLLPMPGSPARTATDGSVAATSASNWRSSSSRPTITWLTPLRLARTAPAYRRGVFCFSPQNGRPARRPATRCPANATRGPRPPRTARRPGRGSEHPGTCGCPHRRPGRLPRLDRVR